MGFSDAMDFSAWWKKYVAGHDMSDITPATVARDAWWASRLFARQEMQWQPGGQVVGVHGERGRDDSPPGHRVLPEVMT